MHEQSDHKKNVPTSAAKPDPRDLQMETKRTSGVKPEAKPEAEKVDTESAPEPVAADHPAAKPSRTRQRGR